jgi:hypothetical protein
MKTAKKTQNLFGTCARYSLLLATFSLALALSPLSRAEVIIEKVGKVNPVISEDSTEPQAIVLTVTGKCEYSEDGNTFSELKDEQVLKQGTTLRTGSGSSRADVFFRRTGTTVRLQPDTEIRLEKMTREMRDGRAEMRTLLDLKSGRIFTVVRSFLPGSRLEVRNAAGVARIEGAGSRGRYIITADGSHVTDKNSDVPLQVVRETGVTIIKPGQQFFAKDGKLLAQDPSEEVKSLIQFDEIHALAEKWDKPRASK